MKTTLQNITTVQSGIYVTPEFSGEVVYLQASNFNEHGLLSKALIPNLFLTNQTQRHLLQPGDILFAAKGTKNFAAVYEKHNGLCVASSTFLVIRITEDAFKTILPEFLAWYINNPTAQKWLKGKAIGSALPSISKSALLELEVSIPTIEKQQAILKINSLRNEERTIQNNLITLREQYIQQLLQNTLK